MRHKKKQEVLKNNKNIMKKIETPKENSLSVKELVGVGGALIVYFFYAKSKDTIINYPNWLLYMTILIVCTVISLFTFKDEKAKYLNVDKRDRMFFVGLALVRTIIIAYFISGILLIPFNYYTINSSKSNPLKFENCEIVKITTETQNRKVFYKFNGKTYILYAYKPIMEELKNSEAYKEYFFVAGVRQSILNTYILENWDIERK